MLNNEIKFKVIKKSIINCKIFIAMFCMLLWFATAFFEIEFEIKFRIINLFGCLVFLICLLQYTKLTKTFLCPYIVFFSIFFLFQFGQNLLHAFNITYQHYVFKNFRQVTLINGTFFSIFCILFFNLGAILSTKINKTSFIKNGMLYKKEMAFKKTSTMLFLISFLPAIYYIINNIYLSMRFGYASDEFNMGINSPFLIVASIVFPTSCMLLMSFSDFKSKNFKVGMGSLLIFAFLGLLVGTRSFALGAFLSCFLIAYAKKLFTFKSIKKHKIFIALSIILSFAFLNALVYTRTNQNRNALDFINAMFGNSLFNIVVDSIGEMGFSITPTYRVFEIAGVDKGFAIGESYIISLLAFIPTIFTFGALDNVKSKALLDQWLTDYLGTDFGLGFSLNAEGYYNFGIFGVFALLFLGYLFGKFLCYELGTTKSVNNEKIYMSHVFILLLFTLPRRQFFNFMSILFYSFFCIYLAASIIKSTIYKPQILKKGIIYEFK